MTDQKKWSCAYCTYHNWIASGKCTLCNASKPLQYITEPTSSQDIYKMASLMQQPSIKETPSAPSTSIEIRGSENIDPNKKWSCQICTYLNWPKALRCTQCQTEKGKLLHSSNEMLASNNKVIDEKYSSPLSINVSIAEASGGCATSPHHSPNGREAAAKSGNNEHGRAVSNIVSAAVRGKWICTACTYENWPKSTKCVICNTVRGFLPRDYTPPLSTPEGIRSKSCSPESPDGASAPISVNHSNKSDRQQKNTHISDLDWTWLNACMGVVDGNIRAVETFIIRAGDPSRIITHVSCFKESSHGATEQNC